MGLGRFFVAGNVVGQCLLRALWIESRRRHIVTIHVEDIFTAHQAAKASFVENVNL